MSPGKLATLLTLLTPLIFSFIGFRTPKLRVRKIIPTHYVMHRNNAGNTADEFFEEQHAELLERAQKWIKDTSQSCSAVSVVTFLSILSSPFEYGDFRKSLPRKLAEAFSLLFISVITTMISFGTAIFLVIRFEKIAWTNTLVYTAAFFPVSVFALAQFPLYSAFIKTLQTLFKKIVNVVNPRKLIPRVRNTE
ncbi:hypothetical protein SO802_007351 [Lithocarpus litseifolius]|uniref:PGG domain-containing protein n=1 Tax=Lithocarpus litseifolius TaxID=425828 RepID=A0AAW2DNN5_9ROSI